MSVRAKDLAKDLVKEATLCRESGHTEQAARLVAVAKERCPDDECITREERKIQAVRNPSFPKARWALSTLVDRLGLPLFFILMATVAWLLEPIMFVSSN